MSKEKKAQIENAPWNKGKAVEQMTPFTPGQAQVIRALLNHEKNRFVMWPSLMSGLI